jgi:hypothetical protein
MKTFKLNMEADCNGTHRQAEIDTTYAKIAKVFGPPIGADDCKVSGEWVFTDEDGNVFTLYDWKSTSPYDSYLPTVEEFRRKRKPVTFNIGGHTYATDFLFWLKSKLDGAKL